jgi:sortase (surface protein transpeptidase)
MSSYFKRFYLVLSSGLGLGLGLGLMMAFYPAQIQADLPQNNIARGVEIIRVKSADIGIDTPIKRGQATILPLLSLEAPAVHLERSAGIGGGQPIIIQGLNKDYSLYNLNQAQLGDEVFVIGSNDGWYRYTVVETKVIDLEQLSSHLSQLREVMILYTVNPWQKTALLVIARPRT